LRLFVKNRLTTNLKLGFNLQMNKLSIFFIVQLIILGAIHAQTINPVGPLPSSSQLQWQEEGFYLFTHFGPNTFTDLEWGKGTEKEAVFNPSQLDCRQWCRIAKAAGAKGIIITAKHHDGFCLWPSQYSTHTVAQSKWRNGQGDVLKELAVACKEYGLLLGIYLSPWDRNHPKYGTTQYNQVFINMMKEVLTKYGPVFEFWWDGANGEGPNGKKQVYDFKGFENTIRRLAPSTVVFSDIGPDIRWVGNEQGFAGKTNWNLLDTAGFKRGAGAPPTDTLNQGNFNGKNWIPAECDVSIRPGWFYHRKEDTVVKSARVLFALYLKSVGRGSNLLLNVPPDTRGLFTSYDSAALMGFKELRDGNFKTSLVSRTGTTLMIGPELKIVAEPKDRNDQSFLSLGPNFKNEFIEIQFSDATPVDCIRLEEPLQMGQRVIAFSIQVMKGDTVSFQLDQTTIGHERLLTFPKQMASSIRLIIRESKGIPLIRKIDAYMIDEDLIEGN
jgi:alpha-L-fucosidase